MGEFFENWQNTQAKAWTEWTIRAIMKEDFDPTKTQEEEDGTLFNPGHEANNKSSTRQG